MPITGIVNAGSLTPAHAGQVRGPQPQRTITAAPFSPAAQKQANAINTGRQPNRGQHVDIKV